jgi:hypothetical protein
MHRRRILANRYAVGCLLLVMTTPIYASHLSMSIKTSRRFNRPNNTYVTAAAGNANPVAIYVLVTNPDTGEGITNLTPDKPGQTVGNWNNDLNLPETKWSFSQDAPEPGPRLRILRITNLGDGLYKFDILPVVGARGQRKNLSAWVKGDYIFLISYSRDRGNGEKDYGHVLGTLTID